MTVPIAFDRLLVSVIPSLQVRVACLELRDDLMPTSNRTSCYYWRVSDADALYREFASVGVPSLTEPSDEPWGMREFTLKDPAGNLIQSVTS